MIVKTFLIIMLIIISFLIGFACAPHPPLKFDPLTVKGFEYGTEQGSFIINKETVKVKRVFLPSGLKFIQEPDGTIHLFVRKGEAETLTAIKANQASSNYSLNVRIYNFFQQAYSIRTQLVSSITGLFGSSEPPPEEAPQ
ncbi:hypothetical protein ACFL27_20050 [candidate division CSSED10-310 bacterium]|uniref:DUF2846 domain-containing protein n=1 Tax=candidate division CSSED10-310 bacterium TaxID=2855610 RepID=A0ABV6Z2D4_UNCC1